MFSSVLIANRGEIACRIARTAKRLGMRTIAVYSAADAHALHTRSCDEAYCIGAAEPRDSYLAIERLIDVAKRAAADCVHPGYGLLAENADFAQACSQAGTVFVGPPATAIHAMGRKDHAKALMANAGVPVVPGYHGERQEAKFLKQKAAEIGYPVLIKPAAGGGGRGMRRVDKPGEFEAELDGAMRECAAAFGSSRMLIERYVPAPRHIEIQIFADSHGNVVHLGERDCSLQRRHQKVIEEAPAPGMTTALRAAMGATAVKAARAVGYSNAGTLEFVADGTKGLHADAFWFIEMNTRLQVEHAVTEAITGLDLVEWQFRIACGEELPLMQEDIRHIGHAIEARIYAEDPTHGFLPSTGRIVAVEWPSHVRVDTGVEAGSDVTPYYDAMLAKLIAKAPTRAGALSRLATALDHTLIAGPRSNLDFLAALCRAAAFRQGAVDTGFIDRNLAALRAVPQGLDRAAAALGIAHLLAGEVGAASAPNHRTEPYSPWDARDGFQLGSTRSLTIPVSIDGESAMATVRYGKGGIEVSVDGVAPAGDGKVFQREEDAYVLRGGRQTRVRVSDFAAAAVAAGAGDGTIRSPMYGKMLQVFVGVGDSVEAGQRLLVIEAMKMEHTLRAPFAGVVTQVAVVAGAQVVEGAAIMVIKAAEQS
ncbi:MAG TPA: biotin carboxylase N-terminal domain-containing protein [Xanthobacteraceae bacterium]|jgi:3-methylcrotonyl-CoA carboxylase alpha subunit